jgi:hypothetical protein
LPERFVTLFDSNFLPQGLALRESLARHSPGSELWVICMDERLEASLARLALPGLVPIALRELEDERLLKAKANRSVREYCWTLTCFSFDAVFDRCPSADRVTYLDADLFFYRNPERIFALFEASKAAVLVTEHGFDPEYDKSEIVGRFCVQFLTMDRSERARELRAWWQERVLEWCYDRRESGRFGDQKYLDRWPELFGDRLFVLPRRGWALAPWNVRMEARLARGVLDPVFYHFHSFRLVRPRLARMVEGGYAIPRAARRLYAEYLAALGRALGRLEGLGIEAPTLPLPKRPLARLRHWAKLVLGRADLYANVRTKNQ